MVLIWNSMRNFWGITSRPSFFSSIFFYSIIKKTCQLQSEDVRTEIFRAGSKGWLITFQLHMRFECATKGTEALEIQLRRWVLFRTDVVNCSDRMMYEYSRFNNVGLGQLNVTILALQCSLLASLEIICLNSSTVVWLVVPWLSGYFVFLT